MLSLATSLVQVVAHVAVVIVVTVVLAETTIISNLRKNTYIYGRFPKGTGFFAKKVNLRAISELPVTTSGVNNYI